MPHAIVGDRFQSRGKSAWHGLGEVFPDNTEISASEAVQKIASDVLVTCEPLTYSDPTGEPVTTGHYAVVRHPLPDAPDSKVLGVVTKQWHQISYQQLAESLDDLSKKYRVETAGLINEGGLLFLAFRGEDFSVAGDEIRDYFVANLSHTPGKAHAIMASPVRVVCSNTNLMAKSQSTINLQIPHSQSAADRIKLAGDLVARFKEMSGKTQETFELFAKTTIDTPAVEQILRSAFPNPSLPTELKLFQAALSSAEAGALEETMGARFGQIVQAQESYDKKLERIELLRDTAKDHYSVFEPAALRGTAWAAYNTVTELADWREGAGAERSSLYGNRAAEKSRAFAATLEVCNS